MSTTTPVNRIRKTNQSPRVGSPAAAGRPLNKGSLPRSRWPNNNTTAVPPVTYALTHTHVKSLANFPTQTLKGRGRPPLPFELSSSALFPNSGPAVKTGSCDMWWVVSSGLTSLATREEKYGSFILEEMFRQV